MFAAAIPASAMPPFAQSYGVNCTVCHTEVPGLNSFGRYVQRSGYAILDHKVLQRSLPLWLGVSPSFDSQAGSSGNSNSQAGNVALHAVGLIGDFSYHIQQWLVQNNAPGGLDTAWFSYNGLFDHNGHLFAGKIETPAPSPFSQWFDLANFASAGMTVGEHTYELDTNRWGSRFSYVRGAIDAEAAWLGSNGDLGGTSDFTNDTDKTFQWKLANANPNHGALEYGAYGSRGSWPLQEGGTDQYYSVAAYVQHDPEPHMPGIFAIYQDTHDADPGPGLGAAGGNALTFELYQHLFHDNAVVSGRFERTNDGLGNRVNSGNVDFEYHLARFVHAYVETYFAQGSKPGLRYMLWWTTPLERPR
ncbi:MAG: hypothetical protein JO322_09160 [Candidatus Eremiobacteraeota bacterium]|nr:hypothetical protein [Candidatus Eremiobacteraeota bacterium]